MFKNICVFNISWKVMQWRLRQKNEEWYLISYKSDIWSILKGYTFSELKIFSFTKCLSEKTSMYIKFFGGHVTLTFCVLMRVKIKWFFFIICTFIPATVPVFLQNTTVHASCIMRLWDCVRWEGLQPAIHKNNILIPSAAPPPADQWHILYLACSRVFHWSLSDCVWWRGAG